MKQTGTETRMREQATTDPTDAKRPLLGQGMLALPGIGELWLVWSEQGLVMLSLPDRAPGEIEADMVDMETYAVLRACQSFGVPLLALRGISDGAAELAHVGDWTQYLHVIDEKLAAAIDLIEASV